MSQPQQEQQHDPLTVPLFGSIQTRSNASMEQDPTFDAYHKRKTSTYNIIIIALSIITLLSIAFAMVLLFRRSSSESPINPPNGDSSTFTMLQINDVYELFPVAGMGGLPRVATLQKQYLHQDPELLTVLSGDFFSPSALGYASVQTKDDDKATPLQGRQMVDLLNRLESVESLYVTFGNHEFDLNKDDFSARLNESKFTYISTNVYNKDVIMPKNVVPYVIRTIRNIKIAIISLTLECDTSLVNTLPYGESIDVIKNTLQMFKDNKIEYDVLVALTHQSLADDSALAQDVPQIDIIMGGHEHENWSMNRGTAQHPVYITKADANAKTAWHHYFKMDQNAITKAGNNRYGTAYNTPGSLHIVSTLVELTNEIESDNTMTQYAQYWTDLAYAAFQADGLDPAQVMCDLTDTFNIQDKETRAKTSRFGQFNARANHYAATNEYIRVQSTEPDTKLPQLDANDIISIINIGSIRIDDILPPGQLIIYDALRILPFGGNLGVTSMLGSSLEELLSSATAQLGSGMWIGYDYDVVSNECYPSPLHSSAQKPTTTIDGDLTACKNEWLINKQPIDHNKTYYLVLPSYIYDGMGKYAWWDNPDSKLTVLYRCQDIGAQTALVEYFTKMYPISDQ